MADDLDDLARRLKAIERALELSASARRLEQSAIGRGGLRVYDLGSIRIEDGGSLVIEEGNLVLGEGMIDGSALAAQLTVDNRSSNRTGFPIAGHWTDIVTLDYQPPAWASQTIVIARSVGIANDPDADWFPQRLLSRFTIAGTPTPEAAGGAFMYLLQRTAAALTYAWSSIADTSSGEPIRVAFQARGDNGGTIQTTDNRVGVNATFINLT